LQKKSKTVDNAVKELEGNHNVNVNITLGHVAGTDNPGNTDNIMQYSAAHPAGLHIIEVTLDLGKVPGLNYQASAEGGVTVNDVVGHEIYSHAVPFSRGGVCHDAPSTCAVAGQNFIRRELGEPPRTFGQGTP
jgi:hypothetical protein